MLNELVPKNVKAATVALGLVKKGSAEPFVICGSGFLVDPKGYVMTAGHVLGKIRELMESVKRRKLKLSALSYGRSTW
jgi:S1-C subfamily serine protease